MTLRDVRFEPPRARSSGEGLQSAERLVRGLIRHAARNAPAALSERLEEEWFADLAARRGALARLRFALGCCWATKLIALEFGAPARAAATAAPADATALCTQAGPSFYSRRTTVWVLIVCLHALVIYGLVSGMARTVLESVPDRVQVIFLPKPTPRYLPPPPLPPPRLHTGPRPLRPKTVPPDLTVDVQLDRVTIPDESAQPREFPLLLPPPQHVIRVIGGPGPGFPNTADFYPDAARRLSEQGSASVRVCVDGSGRLAANPTIAESSGSARLDQGALRLAKAGAGHYRATTEDGKPVSGCYAFRVRFQLKD
jgi:periplasmic protein TonB